MRRPYKTSNTALGARLEAAIAQQWGSHRALADHTGIREGTISKYVRHGRVPAGEEMVKLAEALPGQIDYILTGRQPSELQQRTVGSLPPLLQELVRVGITLSDEMQGALVSCAKLFARGLTSSAANIVLEVVQAWTQYLQRGREVGPDDPLFPPTTPAC